MRVATCQCGDLWRKYRGNSLFVFCALNCQDPRNKLEFSRLSCYRGSSCRQNRDINFRTLDAGCASNRLRCARIKSGTIVFRNNENFRHHASPLSFSAATRPATSSTITPRSRSAGGSNDSSLISGPRSTPRSASAIVSSGFFFAFMISGSLT